jgi:excisionase family DNA binding protein
MTTPTPGSTYTVREAAALLKLDPQTVRRWVRAGRVESVQIGGKGGPIRIDADSLHALMAGDDDADADREDDAS